MSHLCRGTTRSGRSCGQLVADDKETCGQCLPPAKASGAGVPSGTVSQLKAQVGALAAIDDEPELDASSSLPEADGSAPAEANWKPLKIIEVRDTRTYEEGPDDRWHAVPGSGTVNQCDRCGKDHEVHVVVEDQAGQLHVVGTGCAQADGPVAKRMTNIVSATQKLAALKGQLAVAEAYWAKRSAVEAELVDLFPGWEEGPAPSLSGTPDPRRAEWRTKDGLASCWVRLYPDEAKPEWERASDWARRRDQENSEREESLRRAWLSSRAVQEVGAPPSTPDVATLQSEVAKTEARLACLRDKMGKEHLSLEQAAEAVIKRTGVDQKKKAAYTEADLVPHLGKTVTVAPKPGKAMSSHARYYKAPVTGTLHSVWKDNQGNVLGFRLALTKTVTRAGQASEVTEVEEFANGGHATLELSAAVGAEG